MRPDQIADGPGLSSEVRQAKAEHLPHGEWLELTCLDFLIHVEVRISRFGELVGRAIAQTAVGSLAVIFLPPTRDLLPGIGQVPKPAGVQTLIPQPPTKTFHVAVLHRPSRLNVNQLDLPLFAPAQEMPRG